MGSTLIISVLFLAFDDKKMVGFLFDDMKLSRQNYAYYLFEHINALIIAICFVLPGRYILSLIAYIVIQFVDTADFILTYGNIWWVNGSPWPWNSFKILLFGSVFIYEKYVWKTS